MIEDPQAQLLTEQICRLRDQFNARLILIDDNLTHKQSINTERLETIRQDIKDLKDAHRDHETRLRSLTDAVTSLKTAGSIAQAAQAALTLVAAAIAAWLGSQ